MVEVVFIVVKSIALMAACESLYITTFLFSMFNSSSLRAALFSYTRFYFVAYLCLSYQQRLSAQQLSLTRSFCLLYNTLCTLLYI